MHSLTEVKYEQHESNLDINLKSKQNIAATLHYISTLCQQTSIDATVKVEKSSLLLDAFKKHWKSKNLNSLIAV